MVLKKTKGRRVQLTSRLSVSTSLCLNISTPLRLYASTSLRLYVSTVNEPVVASRDGATPSEGEKDMAEFDARFVFGVDKVIVNTEVVALSRGCMAVKRGKIRIGCSGLNYKHW